MHPRAVVVILFRAVEQIARTELLRCAENGPPIGMRATFHLEEILRQRLGKFHMGICSRAKVADIRVIRTFFEIHPLHKLRDDGVHVRVALAVRVRWQVQRHIVEENGDIRAMVEIEAAQKILVGLAAAGVLRDDEAGNRLQNLSRTKNRTILDLRCAHRSLGAGFGNADQVILTALHVDGGAHGTHDQRDAQRGRRAVDPNGDQNFFGFKTGIHYDEPIISSRNFRKRKEPFVSECTVLCTVPFALRRCTSAPAITAPVVSTTVPDS